MCGINGIIKSNINNQDLNRLSKMNDILSHRGPDNSDIFASNKIALGHTRLAIIDLNSRSNQPFKKNNLVLIFNGEIYNYKELKTKLPDVSFNTDSDTEVILELWRKYNFLTFNMLRGMFALAIHDLNTNETIIARDHFGIKPLHYFKNNNQFVFSSEIKAIKGAINDELYFSKEAIVESTLYCWITEKNCIYENIKKLPPGKYIYIKNNDMKIQSYWSNKNFLNNKPLLNDPLKAKGKLSKVLEDSVEKHLISDVPVNAFLSGGLDSSLLVAMAKKKIDTIDCYNIKFSDIDQRYEANSNDHYYAKKIAKNLNVKLNTIEVLPNLTQLLEKIVYYLDEPIGDSAAINTYLICENAKKNGVKVLLSGMGSDEIFSGYRKHQAIQLKNKLNFIPSFLFNNLDKVTKNIPVKSNYRGFKFIRWVKRFLNILKYSDNNDAYFRSYTYYDRSILNEIFSFNTNEICNSIFDNFNNKFSFGIKNRDLVDAMNFVDINDFMVSLNLKYTDLASMASSTEVRVPYIDMKVIETAFQINSELKLKGNKQKFILKKVAEDWLPSEIIYRPKAGFSLPLRAWIKKDLNSLVSEYLISENGLKKRKLFNKSFLNKIVDDEYNNIDDNSQKIWQLLTLEQWFRNTEK